MDITGVKLGECGTNLENVAKAINKTTNKTFIGISKNSG